MNEFLKSIAPTLASALLGPLGGVAVAALGKVIGVDNATTTTITKAFQDGKLTPDQLVEIKKLELEFQQHEKDLEFSYAEIEFKDRDSAREMQKATQSATPTVLTYMITSGFFGILTWMLIDHKVVESAPLMVMLGSLGTAWTGCVAFWFGKNSGSDRTKELLAQATIK